MRSDTVDVTRAARGAADPVAYEAAEAPLCHNCEERISGEPVYFDGEAYCCTGCLNGGPCRCTYTRADAGTAPAPDTGADDTVSQRPSPPADAVGGEPTMVLRVGRFADQPELLRFACDLEADPRVHEVSLIRGSDLADVWLSVRTSGAAELTLALYALSNYELLSTNVLAGGMEALLHTVSSASAEPAAQLLPPRPRPRIAWVRPESSATAPLAADADPVTPPAPPTPAPRAPVVPGSRSASCGEDAPPAAGTIAIPDPPAASTRATDTPVRDLESTHHDGGDRLVGADERPGGAVALTEHVTLVVYPFHSFGALNEFQGDVRDLRGVKSLRVRRFYKGTLHLAVEYEDLIPLVQRLEDLRAFPWTLVSESRSELELRLDAGHSFAPGEGVA